MEVKVYARYSKKEMLQVYEQSEKCKELRAEVIDDDFEKNVNDYLVACDAVNEIANEYFFEGFNAGAEIVRDILKTKFAN